MLFCLRSIDEPGRVETRKKFVNEHRTYRKECGIAITLSGPSLAGDGETMIGWIFLIETPDKAGIQSFIKGDPFTKNDVWGNLILTRFLRRHD